MPGTFGGIGVYNNTFKDKQKCEYPKSYDKKAETIKCNVCNKTWGPSLSQEALERAAALLVGQAYDAGPAIRQAMEMGQAIMDRTAAPEAVEKALLRLHMLMYQVQTISGFSSAGYLWQVRSAPETWLCAHLLGLCSLPALFCLYWPATWCQGVTPGALQPIFGRFAFFWPGMGW
jgi:hypothetical protein